MLPGLTDNNARRPYRFAILHDRQGVVREIYHHIGGTQFPRQPTPALHISKDGINSRSRDLGLTTPVSVSALYFVRGRGDNSVPFFSGASKSSLKLFVLRLLWIKGIQSGSDIVAAGNFFQHLLQIGRLEIEVNGAAYSAECHSARAGVPHESHDRIRQGKFIRRPPLWTAISKSGGGVIPRIKSISSDTMQEVDHLLRSGKRSSGVYPKRCEITPAIKCLNRGSVLQARYVLLKLFRD